MLLRLALALGVMALVSAAYVLWKRPPGRLSSRASLRDVGIEGPAVVQFSSATCAPCRIARPRLVEAARAASVPYEQIDVGDRPEVAKRYGIRTVPTIVVTGPDGRVVGVWTRLPENGEITEVARRAGTA